jgi:hypothetical protein
MGIYKRIITIVAALAFLGLNFGVVAAATATPAGQGLEISPPLIDTKTDPGKTLTFQIKVRNVTKDTVVTSAEIDDFAAVGEEGQSKVFVDKNSEPSPYSFKTWADAIPTVELGPNEVKPITVTLNVPQNAAPGGHYGVVRFSAAPPELEGSGVALNASVGTLVLINVSGKVVVKAQMIDFFTANKDGKRTSFFEKSPVDFVERIQNQGTVHFKPLGTVRVTNVFGGEVAVLTINANGGNVLPASVRRFEQQLNKSHMFGHYKAEANITFSGQNIRQSIGFWVIPYKQVAIVLGVIIIAFVVIRKSLRGYVDKAVKKASTSSKKKSSSKKK